MKNIISAFLKLVILFCLVVGGAIVYQTQMNQGVPPETLTNRKAIALKKHLLTYNRPQRVEINNLTKKFTTDVEEIKKMKVVIDEKSPFYIAIDFFTDETDPEAPLVAQIKFFEIASGNKLKEDNINLE